MTRRPVHAGAVARAVALAGAVPAAVAGAVLSRVLTGTVLVALFVAACATGGAPTAPAVPAPPAASPASSVSAPGGSAPATALATTAPADGTPAATTGADGEVALLPDPAAEWTVGDTVLVSGGEFGGDEANLTVLEAVRLAERDASGNPQYAFLVEIEGLADGAFHYNTLHFALFDDESFKYDAYSDGGREPGLSFGDLTPGRKVKGWLTFLGPEDSEYLELEYAPISAGGPFYVRVLLP